jgi:hypothetical protein
MVHGDGLATSILALKSGRTTLKGYGGGQTTPAKGYGVVQAPPKLAFIHPYNFLFLFLNKKSLKIK